MISISATTYDPVGSLILRARVENAYQGERRGSVIETLDGGVSVYDSGYSDSGKTFTANMMVPTALQVQTLQYLIAYYTDLVLSCESGCYSIRASFALNKNVLAVAMKVLDRLDA